MIRASNYYIGQAGVAELADAQDLGSCGATRGGSNPFARTNDYIELHKIPAYQSIAKR